MVKKPRKIKVERRPLSKRVLSTALAGLLAISVCGTTFFAFATDEIESIPNDLLTENSTTQVVENESEQSTMLDESTSTIPIEVEAPALDDPEEADDASEADKGDEVVVGKYNVAFAPSNASIEYNGTTIAEKKAVAVPADKKLSFIVIPDEGYAVEEVSLQVLSEGIMRTLEGKSAETGMRYTVEAADLAEGMAIVVETAAVEGDEDKSATNEVEGTEEKPETDESVSAEDVANRLMAAAEELAAYDPEKDRVDAGDDNENYKKVNVNFVSRGEKVSSVVATPGAFVTMPAPAELTYEQTIYIYKLDGHERLTTSLEKAEAHKPYATETITYTFQGWSTNADYGALTVNTKLQDTAQNHSLYQVDDRVFCDSLNAKDGNATLYAVWKQTAGRYYAGESLGPEGGDGVYFLNISLLYNSGSIPSEPAVLSEGFAKMFFAGNVKYSENMNGVDEYGKPKQFFYTIYRDIVGKYDTNGANNKDGLGKYNTAGRKLQLEDLVTCPMTTTGANNVKNILKPEFYSIVDGLNSKYHYWDPSKQDVIWYVVKEQIEQKNDTELRYVGWHFDGMVISKDANSEHSYLLDYDANRSDYAGVVPQSTVHEAEKNNNGEFVATATVADPKADVFVGTDKNNVAHFSPGIANKENLKGFEFIGWATTPTPGDKDAIYAPGDQIVLSGNTTLYAQWGLASGEYEVRYYLQQPNGDYAWQEKDTEYKSASIGDSVAVKAEAVSNKYAPLYSYVEGWPSIASGTVLGENGSNNKLVLKLCYNLAHPTVEVTAPSAEKVYDGKALEADLNNCSIGSVPDGFTVSVEKVSGSQTEVGSTASTIEDVKVVDQNGNDVTDLFKVVLKSGTLTVTPQSIVPDPKDPENDPTYLGMEIECPEDVVYNAGEQQQKPIVKDKNGNVLIEGTDYVLTFLDRNEFKNAGPVPFTVEGKGNYAKTFESSYKITPIEAVIEVNGASKAYGENDPEFSGTVTGLLAGDVLGDITYKRTNSDEAAGAYEGVLTADVSNRNGNYSFTVKPGNFTITQAGGNVVNVSADANDAHKVYDSKPISVKAWADKDGSTLEYSVDDPDVWTTENPEFVEVGTYAVKVRATHPNYETSPVVAAYVTVVPAPVTIKVHDAEKMVGAEDPAFTGDIEGLVNGDELGTVKYFRTNSGVEAAGTYKGALSAFVEFCNKNYSYTVVPGTFTIKENTPVPDPTQPTDPVDPVDPPAPVDPVEPVPVIPALTTDITTNVVDPVVMLAEALSVQPTTVNDDEAPLASFDNDEQPFCWVHPWMILGALLTVVGGVLAIMHRRRQVWLMDDDLDEVCLQNVVSEDKPVAPSSDPVRA